MALPINSDLLRALMSASTRANAATTRKDARRPGPGLGATLGKALGKALSPYAPGGGTFGPAPARAATPYTMGGGTPAPAPAGSILDILRASQTPAAPGMPGAATMDGSGKAIFGIPVNALAQAAKMREGRGGLRGGLIGAGIGAMIQRLMPEYKAAQDQGFEGTFQDYLAVRQQDKQEARVDPQMLASLINRTGRMF